MNERISTQTELEVASAWLALFDDPYEAMEAYVAFACELASLTLRSQKRDDDERDE